MNVVELLNEIGGFVLAQPGWLVLILASLFVLDRVFLAVKNLALVAIFAIRLLFLLPFAIYAAANKKVIIGKLVVAAHGKVKKGAS